jgi:hypothetical protein
MGTRVGQRNNWQAEPAIDEGSREVGASAIRVSVEAIHPDCNSDALYAGRTEPFLVQNEGGRAR